MRLRLILGGWIIGDAVILSVAPYLLSQADCVGLKTVALEPPSTTKAGAHLAAQLALERRDPFSRRSAVVKLPEADWGAALPACVTLPVAPASAAHSPLERGSTFLESVLRSRLLLLSFLAVRDEGFEGFDLMFEILNHEFDHDCIVEIAEAGNAVGNQIVWIGEVGERVQHPLTVCAFEPPIFVFDHFDQLPELGDSLLNVLRCVGSGHFFEQFFSFAKNDILVLGVSTLTDLLQDPSEIA